MKLVRYGSAGQEKPGILDSTGAIRDLSGAVADIGGETLSPAGLARIAIHTTTGPVNLELYHLDAAVARRVLEDQVALARAARTSA